MKTPFRIWLMLFLAGNFLVSSCPGQNFLSKMNRNIPFSGQKLNHAFPPGFHARLHIQDFIKFHHEKETRNFTYHMDTALVYSNYINPQRYIYSYDSAGNQIVQFIQRLVNEQWQNISKDSSVYDSVGNRILLISKLWNNGMWENASLSINRFTLNHRVVEKVNKTWQSDHWVPADSTHFTYDENGNEVAVLKTAWVDSTASWINKSFQIFSYDSTGNRTLSLYELWHDTVWLDNQMVKYTYDSASNLTQGLILNWGDTSWVNFYQENYKYDSARNRIAYTGQIWADSVWTNDQHYIYHYNTFGQLDEGVGQNWADSTWVNFEKGQYTYDIFGGIETYLYQQWKNDSVWGNVSLSQYKYDTVGNASIGNYFSWDTTDNTWSQNQDGVLQIFYNYGAAYNYFTGYQVKITYNAPLSTGIDNKPETLTSYACWPNPAVNQTLISFTLNQPETVQINLFNLTGKKAAVLYRGHLDKGEHHFRLVTNKFPAGLYFVSFLSGRQTKTIKLVIRN
jgi:hypothetical protein